MDIEKD